MTRLAALLMLALAGCSTTTPDRATVAAHELVDFTWCSPAQLHQCPMIRQGNELFLLEPEQRIGDGADIWDVRGATVDAFSEGE